MQYTVQAELLALALAGKKLANAAKEGLKMVGDDSASAKEQREALEKEYKGTLDWLKDVSLKDKIEKAVLSERLVNTPCALVASQYGWSGNMERIMRSQAYSKSGDPTSEYYLNQKKIFEINPRHPLVKELHQLVQVCTRSSCSSTELGYLSEID